MTAMATAMAAIPGMASLSQAPLVDQAVTTLLVKLVFPDPHALEGTKGR